MGGPNNLDEVALFLRNMFHDKNILTIANPLLRSLIAHCIVAFRIKEAKHNYSLLGGKSPIVEHTQRLVKALNDCGTEYCFDFAMSYTPPFVHDVIERFKTMGVDDVTLFSLYPQYSTTTTLTSLEAVQKACNALGYYPKISIIDRYFDDELYNEAIIERIQESLATHSIDPAHTTLLFSAHGLPEKITKRGDPYTQEVIRNVQVLGVKLKSKGLIFKNILHAFQSHIGPVRWSKPFISEVLDGLKGESVLVYPIAFSIDNSETDYELSMQYKEYSQEKGIEHYAVCSCLNDSSLFVKAILNLIQTKEQA